MPTVDPYAQEWFEAGVLFAVFVAIALFVRWTLHFVLRFIARSGRERWRFYFKPIRAAIVWGIVLSGLNIALQGIDYIDGRPTLSQWLAAGIGMAWVAIAVLAAVRIINAYFTLKDRAALVDPEYRDRSTLLRKLTVGFVIIVGILAAMRVGGLDIGPLLAGGAIGGVIIGLALQDSLSNVFAGLLLTMDGTIRVGEKIRVVDGPTATVENIGWRSRSLRLLDSTVLVVPNSALSQDRFVNLSRPTLVTSVYIDCGVSYDSDLEHVERVALEVAREDQAGSQGGEGLPEPYLRWKQFADSSVIFRLLMDVPDPRIQFIASSDLMKALHARF
jgi:small-conductance mechanosensitive channel